MRFTGYLKLLEIEEPLEAVLVEGLLFVREVLLGEAIELAVGFRLRDEGVQLVEQQIGRASCRERV